MNIYGETTREEINDTCCCTPKVESMLYEDINEPKEVAGYTISQAAVETYGELLTIKEKLNKLHNHLKAEPGLEWKFESPNSLSCNAEANLYLARNISIHLSQILDMIF